MNPNFHLNIRRHDESLDIMLHGRFNGSSAHELMHAILKETRHCLPIHIHTQGVTHADPFGKAVMESLIPNRELRSRLHFSGALAREISPEGCVFLPEDKQRGHVCKGNCKTCACHPEAKHPAGAEA